ncbi:hypothetical protein [Nocardia brasiliensis]|uniref:hypothetical protein n=1 Tax=Nocardia brasiliensis TaxID=37326 RepID=UPI003D94DA5C
MAERGVAGFDAALAELDRRDLEAATAQYRRFQGAAPDDPGQMLGDWRNGEAARWAAGKQAADLALFAALVSEEQAAAGREGTWSTPAQALTDLWRAWRVREQLGLPQPDLGQHSVSVFRAELDRATEWFHDNEPDYLEQWQRLRSTNPARSDQHLLRRYETEQAKRWAAEVGDDLWKHGFAAAAAKSPGTELEEIARTVWIGAGRPQPAAAVDMDNTATLDQRWQQQISTVERARARLQDWHSPRLDPNIAPAQRDRRTAELVADYHQTQAELWLAEARATGTITDGVSERDPIERIFASWRSHTAGQQVLSEESTQPADALDRAQRWLADNDPAAFLTYQAHLEAVPEHVRDRARAELIRDHDIHHARRFAEYAEKYMGMPEGTAALPADEVLQIWRQYTEAVAAQEHPTNEAANSTAASTQSSRDGSTSNRTSPVSPSLAELVGEAVPEDVREDSKWLGVEQRFRRLVTAGNDPQRLAEGVRSLDYTHAHKPWALTVWKMERVAVGPSEQEPRQAESSQANDTEVTTGRAAAEPSGLHPLVDDLLATYTEWNSPEHREEIAKQLEGMDDEAAEALKIAFLGSGASPRGAVDDAATHSPPRVPPDFGTERSRGQSL